MIFALPFPLLLFEIVLFFFLVSQFGFLKIFGIYLLPCLLGFVVLSLQSRVALVNLQKALMEGKQPGRRLFATAANFLAGLFLLIPSFSTRVVAFILLMPGLRQVALVALQAWVTKKIAQGGAKVFGNFSRGRPGFQSGFQTEFRTYEFRQDIREERDAEVIDVTPLEIEHSVSPKKSPES